MSSTIPDSDIDDPAPAPSSSTVSVGFDERDDDFVEENTSETLNTQDNDPYSSRTQEARSAGRTVDSTRPNRRYPPIKTRRFILCMAASRVRYTVASSKRRKLNSALTSAVKRSHSRSTLARRLKLFLSGATTMGAWVSRPPNRGLCLNRLRSSPICGSKWATLSDNWMRLLGDALPIPLPNPPSEETDKYYGIYPSTVNKLGDKSANLCARIAKSSLPSFVKRTSNLQRIPSVKGSPTDNRTPNDKQTQSIRRHTSFTLDPIEAAFLSQEHTVLSN
ncbi:hypothetical protein GGG16DRAFT_117654 [Schizophyllum commune]